MGQSKTQHTRRLAQLSKKFPAWEFEHEGLLWTARLKPLPTKALFTTLSVTMSSSTARELAGLVQTAESALGGLR